MPARRAPEPRLRRSCQTPGRSSLARRELLLGALALVVAACKREPPAPAPIGRVAAFSLTDQQGRPFSSNQLEGKVWVAAFFFTRCPTVCPRIMAAMKALQDQAKSRDVPLQLVSFSVDPDNDTPPVLKAFAEKYGADLASWTFLTGPEATIHSVSASFKLAIDGKANPDAADFGILHGSHLMLVNDKLEVVGFYSTQGAPEIDKVLDDARRLRG